MPRTYVHDCEAGRKWPGRAWVERLAALDPPDASLVEAYDTLSDERAMSRRWPHLPLPAAVRLVKNMVLASDVDDGADTTAGPSSGHAAKPPKVFTAYTSRAACLDAALMILSAAARKGPSPKAPAGDERFHGVLILDSPTVERSSVAWVAALREALNAGWTVVHVLGAEDDPGRRVERVENLLSLVGREGAYHPMVPGGLLFPDDSPPPQSLETIVVPEVGVLQLYPAAEAASFFPWGAGFLDACRQMAQAAHNVQAASTPLVSVYKAEKVPAAPADDPDERFKAELQQLPSKVAFDTVVTEAVMKGGRRAVIKGGFVLACMPANSTLEFARRLKRRAAAVDMSASIPLIEIVTENRRKRRDALRQFPSRDICTVNALREYLSPKPASGTSHEQHDLLTGELTPADRVAHVTGVIDLLESAESYEVALLPTADLVPVPVGPWYWMATESALFYVGPLADGGTRYVIIRDAAVVEAFFQLVDDCWESFDRPYRDRDTVIATLRDIIADAEAADARRPEVTTA